MKNILITGGPVHAHLDSVKIITNNFKGGLIAELATQLAMNEEAQITYLCNKASKVPTGNPRLKVVFHNGFDDYLAKVLEMAPKMDAVILGAAVANLIPYKAIEGKFPSHNYKPGDLVPFILKIAPRVIDEVKKVAPKTHLFGFKLLDGVDHNELIKAAYGVLLESKATAVIANDRQDLGKKFIVTKERGVHEVSQDGLAGWIWEILQDEYYKTQTEIDHRIEFPEDALVFEKIMEIKGIRDNFKECFEPTPEGYVFGTIALRVKGESFLTTSRGKKELKSFVLVDKVDHEQKIVYAPNRGVPPTPIKATLNAPLLDHIFKTMPYVDSILHMHDISNIPFERTFDKSLLEKMPVLDYAPPGTVRDSIRDIKGSFIIKDHGWFFLYSQLKQTYLFC